MQSYNDERPVNIMSISTVVPPKKRNKITTLLESHDKPSETDVAFFIADEIELDTEIHMYQNAAGQKRFTATVK